MKPILSVFTLFSLCLFLGLTTQAKPKPISGISQEGEVVITGDTNSTEICWIEWAPKIQGPWSADFNEMSYFLVKPGHERAVRVPFFYRVQCREESGLLLYLPLDGNAQDYSGHENHASATSSTLTYSDDAVRGQSAVFDGSNSDFIRIPHTADLTFGPEDTFSFSLWFQSPTDSVAERDIEILFGKFRSNYPDSGVFSYSINLAKAVAAPHFQVYDSHCCVVGAGSHGSWIPDRWQHFASTYSNRVMKTYIDGKLEDVKTNDLSSVILTDGDLYLGLRSIAVTDRQFTGKIDDFMIFDRLLSEDEIAFQYNSNVPAEDAGAVE